MCFKSLAPDFNLLGHEFMRGSRNFLGGGVQARLPENISDNVFRGCPMVISKETIIFKGFRGGPKFSRGGPSVYKGGPNANFYRNPYNF